MTPPTVADVLEALGRRAPWSQAAGWDPVGLQIGDPAASVATAAVCHEVTEEVVDRLTDEPVDLLVAYHPLIFRPLARLVSGRSQAGRAYRVARSGVSLVAVHTAFDVASGGAADALAATLDLQQVRPFAPVEGDQVVKVVTFLPSEDVEAVTEAMGSAGAGRIGAYSNCSFRIDGTGTFTAGEGTTPVTGVAGSHNEEPEVRVEMIVPASRIDAALEALVASHPYEQPAFDVYPITANHGMIGRWGRLATPMALGALAGRVEQDLPASDVRLVGRRDAQIESAAVVPGSGSAFIGPAAALGVDVLVTGDVTHHRAVAARDAGLSVIDAGHAATERPGMRALYAVVREIAPVALDWSEMSTDPWEGAQ